MSAGRWPGYADGVRAWALVEDVDGVLHELVAGDLIGRLGSAGLQIDDARISEAHALVSLRDQALKLLALRGAFAVAGKPLQEVELTEGLVVQLARGVDLTVREVHLPEVVLAIEAEGFPRRRLPPVASLLGGPRPRLVTRYVHDADAHLWSAGDGWRVQLPGARPRTLEPGDGFVAGGRSYVTVLVPLADVEAARTEVRGGVQEPLTLQGRFDTVHILRPGRPPAVVTGLSARLLSELIAFGQPVPWLLLAQQIWGTEEDPLVVRPRLDMTLSRLRRKLRELRLRTDLVRSDGSGNIELFLYASDRAEDHT